MSATRRSRRSSNKRSIEESTNSPFTNRVKEDEGTSTEGAKECVRPDYVPPDTIPSSVCSISSSSMAVPSATASSTHPVRAPVAFVEKDFVVNQEPEEEEEARRAPIPETIISGETTSTGARAPRQPTTTNHDEYKNNNNGVVIKNEDSLAHNDKRRKKEGRITSIKSEELLDNNDEGCPRACDSFDDDSTRPNCRLQTNNYRKRKNNQQGGGYNKVQPAEASTTRRTSPRNKKLRDQNDAVIIAGNAITNETNGCQLCNHPHWENKIFYKCGTVISKYFPKSNNNPNPGWYKGTIRMHHVSSSNSESSSDYDYDSEYEYEEDADGSNERESEHQQIIFNEIHYDDGDTENITQDALKLQVMGGRKVKILHTTRMATVSNSESRNPGNVVPAETSSHNTFDRKWLQKFNRLNKYKMENGNCRVPWSYGPDPSLGSWVRNQRTLYKNGNIAVDRKQKLDNIGFDWVLVAQKPDQIWCEMYNKLKGFQAENGHCRVSKHYAPDPSLGNWVRTQRTQYKRGNVASDRVEKLNNIGFDWVVVAQTPDQMWLEKYDRLKTFKAKNGHCRVPHNYGPDPSLANWVYNQRSYYKKGTLAPDRVEKLAKIGFQWVIGDQIWDQAWQEKYDRLIIFKAENGHCRVPVSYDPDPPLGNWVRWQRRTHREGKMAPDRAEKLAEIGFEWMTCTTS